jgi:hypothetical protein
MYSLINIDHNYNYNIGKTIMPINPILNPMNNINYNKYIRIDDYDLIKKNKSQIIYDEKNLNVLSSLLNSNNAENLIRYNDLSKVNEKKKFHNIDSNGRRSSPFKSTANSLMK